MKISCVTVLLFLCVCVSCTVARVDIKLLTSKPFGLKFVDRDIRIGNIAQLSSISIQISCGPNDTNIEYELPDVSLGTWAPIPSTSSGFFTSVVEDCGGLGVLNLTINLSGISAFNTMVVGDSRKLRIRSVGFVDEANITFSTHTLGFFREIQGQGFSSPKSSGAYTLNGRAVAVQASPSVSGAYTLKSKGVEW